MRLNGLLLDSAQVRIENDCLHPGIPEAVRELLLSNKEANASILHNEMQSFGWMRQVDGKIRGARFHDGEGGDHKFRRAFQSKPDENFRSSPQGLKVVCQLGRSALQLAIGHRLVGRDQRDAIRIHLRLGRNQTRHRGRFVLGQHRDSFGFYLTTSFGGIESSISASGRAQHATIHGPLFPIPIAAFVPRTPGQVSFALPARAK